MKNRVLRLLALMLAAVVLLAGCGRYPHFDDIAYERPDVVELEQLMEQTVQAAETETDVKKLMESVYDYYDQYHWFYTNYSLANIHYSGDLTDIYWEQEYNWCMDKSAQVDAGFDRLMYALADCSLREELEAEEYFGEDYFDEYEGESIWDETFTDLMDQESALITQYYSLSSQEYDLQTRTQMEELFTKLVKLRYRIAQYAGYDSYVDFAYDFYYYRDYTPEQERALLEQIRQELVPVYREVAVSDVWDLWGKASAEEENLEFVRGCVVEMGGVLKDAFRVMEQNGLYNICSGENKYPASFETYLSYYSVPFVFMNPQGTINDKLTLIHEFGHFSNDFACGGSYAGVDVAEVYSQGLEFLSLFYGENTGDLATIKMADSLMVYVEQAAYASFEQGVYALEENEITKENIARVMAGALKDFGLDIWGMTGHDYAGVPHFFTNPLYVISYVVSNDAALQFYALEQEKAGKGLALYEDALDSQESYFLAFLTETGLESPFQGGRVGKMRQIFEEKLE